MNYLSSMTGKGLNELFSQDRFLQAIHESVAPNPTPAVQKIRDAYELGKRFHGWQIPLFDCVCDMAYEAELEDNCSYYLNLMAPHTHWDIRKPIIYTFSKDRGTYIVGNLDVQEDGLYIPVSFFRWDDEVWPYEWIDETAKDHLPTTKNYHPVIERILLSGLSEDDPFGIGIDYRFRYDPIKAEGGTVEAPILDNEELSELSEIYDSDSFLKREWVDGVEVVAWPFKSDLKNIPNLSSKSATIMRKIKEKLRAASSLEEREELFEEFFDEKL